MTAARPSQPALLRLLHWATMGRRPWIILPALCLAVWLPGFASLPPIDRDESRFAQATKQMIETGDLVRIRNGMVARNQKPIGIYWLQLPFAAGARAFGFARANPIWPYRLPSLLGGIAAVVATYGYGRRLVGEPAAMLAALFLAGSVLLAVETHMAKTDAVLLAATTIVMGVLSRAWLDPARLSRAGAAVFWATLGLAILVKGPIALMVCGLAIVWLAVINHRSGWPRWLLALRPVTGASLCAAIVMPWLIAITIATHGNFLAASVGGDLAGKLAASSDAHGAPFGMHLVMLPLLLGGGGIAAIAAVPQIWRARADPAVAFLLAWIVPSWLVFELVTTKLPHYPLPLYPAIALLAARALLTPARMPAWLARLAVIAAVLVMVAPAAVACALPLVIEPGWHSSMVLGLPGLALTVVMVVLLCRLRGDPNRAALLLLAGAPLGMVALLGLELPRLRPLWIAPRIAAALSARSATVTAFGELGFAEPSLVFLCGTQTRIFDGVAAAAQFLAEGPGRVLIVDDRELDQLTRRAGALKVSIALIETLSGYNYSRGLRMRLTLLASVARAAPVRE